MISCKAGLSLGEKKYDIAGGQPIQIPNDNRGNLLSRKTYQHPMCSRIQHMWSVWLKERQLTTLAVAFFSFLTIDFILADNQNVFSAEYFRKFPITVIFTPLAVVPVHDQIFEI